MINPDKFVFHSNFDYNDAVIRGYKDLVNVSMPFTVEIASGLLPGDRFRVTEETADGMYVYNRGGPFPTYNYHAEGGKLYASVGAQQPGTFYTGRFHYRVYRQSKDFIFNSKSAIEKVIFRANGTMSGGYGTTKTIPNTTGKKLILYATWRVAGTDNWYTDGYSGNSPSGVLGISQTATDVTLRFGAGDGTAGTIEYKLVGTDLYGT